nr:MAG TPA: hypothetical protein [Caudoviricetes sp.]
MALLQGLINVSLKYPAVRMDGRIFLFFRHIHYQYCFRHLFHRLSQSRLPF